MLIERLDKTTWTLEQAQKYVANRLFALIDSDRNLINKFTKIESHWLPFYDMNQIAESMAGDDLLVALRDGDLFAKGRLSTERIPWSPDINGGWTLHSGHYTTIAAEHWREGRLDLFRGSFVLTFQEGQFIDILVPRFVVVAIWPTPVDKAQANDQATAPPANAVQNPPSSYRTPYLDLLDRAVEEWKITVDNQPKKDNLQDWFRAQTVEGEPVSENLASAMATLVRLPASQRGGARRGTIG